MVGPKVGASQSKPEEVQLADYLQRLVDTITSVGANEPPPQDFKAGSPAAIFAAAHPRSADLHVYGVALAYSRVQDGARLIRLAARSFGNNPFSQSGGFIARDVYESALRNHYLLGGAHDHDIFLGRIAGEFSASQEIGNMREAFVHQFFKGTVPQQPTVVTTQWLQGELTANRVPFQMQKKAPYRIQEAGGQPEGPAMTGAQGVTASLGPGHEERYRFLSGFSHSVPAHSVANMSLTAAELASSASRGKIAVSPDLSVTLAVVGCLAEAGKLLALPLYTHLAWDTTKIVQAADVVLGRVKKLLLKVSKGNMVFVPPPEMMRPQ